MNLIHSKNKNIRELYRGNSDFKKGYQHRTNIVKDEKSDLVADSHSILDGWRNYFCKLLNNNDGRQIENCVAEPLLPEPNVFLVWDGCWKA
jgi:hypothetical protein